MRHLIASYLNHDLSRRGLFDALAGPRFHRRSGPVPRGTAGSVGKRARGNQDDRAPEENSLSLRCRPLASITCLPTRAPSKSAFFDAFLGQDHTQLIMGLHEGIVISLADGYYRASGKPGFVNIHVIAGTAQAAGQMYNASKDGSAIVVTAGLNDNELWSDDAGLAPRPGFDQKEVNRQFTKISWESRERAQLGADAAPGIQGRYRTRWGADLSRHGTSCLGIEGRRSYDSAG